MAWPRGRWGRAAAAAGGGGAQSVVVGHVWFCVVLDVAGQQEEGGVEDSTAGFNDRRGLIAG